MAIKKATKKFLQKGKPIAKPKFTQKKQNKHEVKVQKRKFDDEDDTLMEFDDLLVDEPENESFDEEDTEDENEPGSAEDEDEPESFFSDNEDDDLSEASDSEEKPLKKSLKPLTSSLLASWKKLEKSQRLKNLILGFDSIVKQHNEEAQCHFQVDEEAKSDVFTMIFDSCSHLNEIFPSKAPNNSSNWKEWKSSVKMLLGGLIEYLDVASDEDTQILMVSMIHTLKKFISAFPKLVKTAVQKLLAIWLNGNNASAQCAVILHKFVVENGKSTGQMILKESFSEFAKSCKNITVFNQPKVQFLINGLVELFEVGKDLSYTILFKVIRQFAVNLRNASMQKTKVH